MGYQRKINEEKIRLIDVENGKTYRYAKSPFHKRVLAKVAPRHGRTGLMPGAWLKLGGGVSSVAKGLSP